MTRRSPGSRRSARTCRRSILRCNCARRRYYGAGRVERRQVLYSDRHNKVPTMNVAVTKAAEGFPRRAFTVDDISRMIAAGVIGEDEKFELIEGEIVMMA